MAGAATNDVCLIGTFIFGASDGSRPRVIDYFACHRDMEADSLMRQKNDQRKKTNSSMPVSTALGVTNQEKEKENLSRTIKDSLM